MVVWLFGPTSDDGSYPVEIEYPNIDQSNEFQSANSDSELAELIKESSGLEESDSENIRDWLECDVDPSYKYWRTREPLLVSSTTKTPETTKKSQRQLTVLTKIHPASKLFTSLR
ncbi:hypothetical protein AVEN_235736-1 [Araneus ventricosus]|uniref:Uncharacterized protein n=1 Tax=Araneus ventricosus TaxID=182803 RepID=A0A4Y2HM13_ARAVE|nr:hypothetical protein AVEN_235736-1 [Araneus ventricosus]